MGGGGAWSLIPALVRQRQVDVVEFKMRPARATQRNFVLKSSNKMLKDSSGLWRMGWGARWKQKGLQQTCARQL